MPTPEDVGDQRQRRSQDSESSEDESPFPARVSWVYTLKKTEIIAELAKFHLSTDGTMPILRRRLVTFLKEGPPVVQPPPSPHFSIPETDASQQAPSPIPTPPRANVPIAPPFLAADQPLRSPATVMPPPVLPPLVTPVATPVVTPSVQPAVTAPHHNISDVCEKVRKWKISFNGKTDPVEFLERICDFQEHSHIPTRSLLPALHQVFEGNALEWYRNNRSLWTEWDDFLSDFRQFYLPVDYQSHLEDEIFNRRQRTGEPGRDYVVALQTLMRRHGGFSPEKALHRLYGNMSPEYRQYIRRTDIQNPRDLVTRIDEFEALRREMRSARPSPNRTPSHAERPTSAPESASRNFYRPPPIDRRHRAPPSNNGSRQPTTAPVVTSTARQETRAAETAPAQTVSRNNVCWRCGETGHFRSQCRRPARLFCSRCGRNDVMTRDCRCTNQGN